MSFYPRRFVAWHPVLTDHQAFTYQELSIQSGLPVIAQVWRLEDETRRSQGWSDTSVTTIERQVIPARGSLKHCLQKLKKYRNDVHFFGSAFEKPGMMICLLMAACLGIEFYLISEPYSPVSFGYFSDRAKVWGRIKARLRPLIYRFYVIAIRWRLRGIFAISRLALAQYEAAGMQPDRLFPFGYFIPLSPSLGTTSNNKALKKGCSMRLVFVGSLIGIKGLDVLIEAVRRSREGGFDINLDIFGPGEPSLFDIDGEIIQYLGRIPFGHAQKYIKGYDLMVLPSRYDGWGVVVNEALCAGVPVLCSDQVGARVLIETFGAGAVFPCGNAKALADLLGAVASDRTRLHEMQQACPAANKLIQPSVAAAYILNVIRAPEGAKALIPSPWY
jgi:glycosyltransferase involved in cell wall biosynthesis